MAKKNQADKSQDAVEQPTVNENTTPEETSPTNEAKQEVIETTSPADKSQDAVEQPGFALKVGVATSQVIASSIAPEVKDSRLVTVIINYPEDYKKQKFFANGCEKAVSPEVAEQFVKDGIASYK
jgi:hypothetical protein